MNNICPACQFVSKDESRCPNMRDDDSHVTCPICSGPVHPVIGCRIHPGDTKDLTIYPPRQPVASVLKDANIIGMVPKPEKTSKAPKSRSKN
jgi:hypothetical protein